MAQLPDTRNQTPTHHSMWRPYAPAPHRTPQAPTASKPHRCTWHSHATAHLTLNQPERSGWARTSLQPLRCNARSLSVAVMLQLASATLLPAECPAARDPCPPDRCCHLHVCACLCTRSCWQRTVRPIAFISCAPTVTMERGRGRPGLRLLLREKAAPLLHLLKLCNPQLHADLADRQDRQLSRHLATYTGLRLIYAKHSDYAHYLHICSSHTHDRVTAWGLCTLADRTL